MHAWEALDCWPLCFKHIIVINQNLIKIDRTILPFNRIVCVASNPGYHVRFYARGSRGVDRPISLSPSRLENGSISLLRPHLNQILLRPFFQCYGPFSPSNMVYIEPISLLYTAILYCIRARRVPSDSKAKLGLEAHCVKTLLKSKTLLTCP